MSRDLDVEVAKALNYDIAYINNNYVFINTEEVVPYYSDTEKGHNLLKQELLNYDINLQCRISYMHYAIIALQYLEGRKEKISKESVNYREDCCKKCKYGDMGTNLLWSCKNDLVDIDCVTPYGKCMVYTSKKK